MATKLAHVSPGGVITDFPVAAAGFTLAQCYHADYLAACVEVPENALIGWVLSNGGYVDPATILPSQAELMQYLNAKQWALATGGFTLTIGGRAVTFATDVTSFALITGKAARLQQPNAPANVNWQFGPNEFVAIPAADFLAAAAKIADFMQATFDALPAFTAAITSGTITAYPEIENPAAPLPQWPVAQG